VSTCGCFPMYVLLTPANVHRLQPHPSNSVADGCLPCCSVPPLLFPVHCRAYGPPSLRAIAAAVMQAKLNQELEHLEQIQTTRLQASQLHDTADNLSMPSIPAKASAPLDASSSNACCDLACSSSSSPCCDSPRCSRHAGASRCGKELERACTTDSASSAACCAAAAASSGAAECKVAPAAAEAVELKACNSSTAGCSGLSRATSSGWYEEQCCVCWEEDVSVAIGPCMHALCLACARQLVASSSRTGATCPLCRSCIAEFGLLPGHKEVQGMKLVSGAGI
jgi:hypothetical protein